MKKRLAKIWANKTSNFVILTLAVTIALSGVAAGIAQYFQPNIRIETFLNDGSIVQPTAFAFAPDGRMFIAQRNGDIKVVWAGFHTAASIKHVDVDDTQEHGLLNLVLDPNFATNPYMYIYYTGPDSHVRIARARVGQNYIEPFEALWTARGVSTSGNHQGGGMEVDNYNQILFSTGDNYVSSNSQDVSNDYGKVFRINTDGTIPADNPYQNTPGASPALFATGVRNPFSLIVDRNTNGVYIGDVGQSSYEEINAIDKGKNYGWPYQEGHNCTTDCDAYVKPLFTYAHPTTGQTPGAAVVAGHAYHGNYYGGMFDNLIFYADGMQGRINTITKQGMDAPVLKGVGFIVDMTTDSDGQLYFLDYYAGKILRLNYGTGPMNDEPYANPECEPTSTTVETTVTCHANAGDQNNDPLSYEWDLGDGRTLTSADPTFSYDTPGHYDVRLKLSDGHAVLPFPPTAINVGEKPTVELVSPEVTTPLNAGSTVNYQIAAAEANGTQIADDKVSVTVKFHHNTHSHEFVNDKIGKKGSFTIPTNIETDLDIWLRLYITVTDQNGAETTMERDLFYNEAVLELSSKPVGASITIDGTTAANQDGFVGVSGIVRQLAAPETHTVNGFTYRFNQWSDGVTERVRSMAFPSGTTQLVAQYIYDVSLNSPSDSLILNGSFEDMSGGTPVNWSIITTPGTIGSDKFTTARTGAYGCQVSIAMRTVSAQKACAAFASVNAGTNYRLRSWYKANRYSRLMVEYFDGNTLLDAEMLAKPAQSNNWSELDVMFQTPPSTNKVRLYQMIDGVGTLSVDDYSLTAE